MLNMKYHLQEILQGTKFMQYSYWCALRGKIETHWHAKTFPLKFLWDTTCILSCQVLFSVRPCWLLLRTLLRFWRQRKFWRDTPPQQLNPACTCTVHTTKSVHFDKIILKEKRTVIMKGEKSLSLKMKAPFFSSLGWSPIQNLFHLFCGRLTNRIQARSPQVRTLTVLQGHFFSQGVYIFGPIFYFCSVYFFQTSLFVCFVNSNQPACSSWSLFSWGVQTVLYRLSSPHPDQILIFLYLGMQSQLGEIIRI